MSDYPRVAAEGVRLRKALIEVLDLLENLPGGIDYEADPTNESPKDSVRHMAGLAYQRGMKAMEAQ